MLVFGGWNSDNEHIYDEMYAFDSVSCMWRIIERKHGSPISARESLSANFINGYIYLFGG